MYPDNVMTLRTLRGNAVVSTFNQFKTAASPVALESRSTGTAHVADCACGARNRHIERGELQWFET